MIRNFLDAILEDVPGIHDGKGTLKHKTIFNEDDFSSAIEFLNYTILPPDTTIGIHTHGNDEELYIVLKGSGTMHVDGMDREVKPGDIILNRPFGTHGLANKSRSEIQLLVIGVKIADR